MNSLPVQSSSLLPLRQLRPADAGGSIARAGFAFQDHVAARFCIQMLLSQELVEVWCETYDDIVLVWKQNSIESFEFVQVKAESPDQLWTPALLCQRDKKKGEAQKDGSSVMERSLAHDCCCEPTSFRLVTAWELNSDLSILKLERSHSDRAINTEKFKNLLSEIQTRIGNYQSAKGSGCQSWLERTFWEVDSVKALEQTNCLQLLQMLEKMNLPATTDSAKVVYEGLLTLVKNAAERPDTEREKKFLKTEAVRKFVVEQASPFPGLGPNERLNRKLTDAGLPATECETAQDLRRSYLMAIRTRPYLETGGPPAYANAILHRLLKLRAKRDSGELHSLDNVGFHSKCLEEVDAVMASDSNNDGSSAELGAGCMYDITARCRHRFTPLKT